jgi:ethanolamine ammonia-lyase small subunit
MARVELGRVGEALPTKELLKLRRARTAAGDAIHEEFDAAGLVRECERRRWDAVMLRGSARDRGEYLRRPDLGRILEERSRDRLRPGPYDASIVIADGLSPLAVHRHAIAVLELLTPKLVASAWRVAPITVVAQGRVAIADDVASAQASRLSLILIGERPGLSASDSLGAYMTWAPQPGRTDADRNCISNIRPEGLSYEAAAHQLYALMTAARQRQLSGVGLKLTGLPEPR